MLKKVFVILALIVLSVSAPAQARDYRYIDMHLHYLNFVQQTQGFDALLAKMDEQGVTGCVVFGMPYNIEVTEKSVNNPNYYLSDDSRVFWYAMTDVLLMDDYLKLSPDKQKRFYPFVGGANTNNMNSAREIERLLQMYPGKFKGIGELMFRHDFLSWKAGEPAPTPDSPAADAIFALAARYKLPVILHHNITSLRADEPIYAFEMENALKKHPATNIVWAHVGQSYYLHVKDLPAVADRLLGTYANLYFDLSWVVFEQDIAATPASLKTWAKLLMKYPDRFLIGTDSVGWFDGYNIRKYDRLLDLVDEATAAKVSRDNFLRLIGEQ